MDKGELTTEESFQKNETPGGGEEGTVAPWGRGDGVVLRYSLGGES